MAEEGSPAPREGLKWVKVARFLALPFSPDRLKTYRRVKRFEDVPADDLLADGIEGVLLDVDGTLGPHHTRTFPDSVVTHVKVLQAVGLKVALFTNAFEDRFEQFEGVPVVTNVPPKPDPAGFHTAMRDYLKLDDPAKVVMIGDNYITDGGAIDAGMRFIHVKPVPGGESAFHHTTRYLAELFARAWRPVTTSALASRTRPGRQV
ncbi:HAD family hydrolase [Nitrospina sp. 32_T5]|uniref:HAD family hydrolase n=1 Tax=unclassified Nitrospina TaxID=2638683 RepID=UPI003F9AE751